MPTQKTKSLKQSVTKALRPTGNSKPSPLLRMIAIALGSVVTVAVVWILVVIVGAYTGRWSNEFTVKTAKVVPFPALAVNGHWRTYSDYLEIVSALDQSYSKPEALQANGLTAKPARADIERLVLDRMVKEEMVRQFATARGIKISQTELDAAMKDVISQTGNEETVKTKIKDLYGWDLNTFARRVVEPFLIRQRLQEKISLDDDINADQKSKAEALLVRVKEGKQDFGEIAAEVNEDGTKGLKGDYGVFGKGEREQSIEEAAFALNVGETSGLLRTVDGFHILKLLEKIPADSKAGTEEKVHVSHIFLAVKQIDAWLYEQAPSQKVSVYITGLTWDKASATLKEAKTDSVGNQNASQ